MALRSASSLLCSSWPRISWGCLQQVQQGLGVAGLQDHDDKEKSHVASSSQGLLLPGSGVRGFSSLLRPAGHSSSPRLVAQHALLKSLGNQQGLHLPQLQRRNLNAWSPAQRYFVEGDHVITAEATRTIQFTGLDSGSFYPFVVWTAFATAVAAVFVILPFIIAPTRVDLDKSSAYECGFDAFGEARQTFSVSFYLVSIMYLLFDIEIAYLFPYVMTHANAQMFWTMNLFLAILVAGFVYEWGVGALEWRDTERA